MTSCIVCLKKLEHGLYDESRSRFCNTVCATWFARAVVHSVELCEIDEKLIDRWLCQYTQVQKKRGTFVKTA